MGKVAINRKRRPTHPGAILREDLLPAAGIIGAGRNEQPINLDEFSFEPL